jgi:hypothetical protein
VIGTALGWATAPTIALAVALAIAWVAAFPVNYALLKRGRGHALVHAHHHGGHSG